MEAWALYSGGKPLPEIEIDIQNKLFVYDKLNAEDKKQFSDFINKTLIARFAEVLEPELWSEICNFQGKGIEEERFNYFAVKMKRQVESTMMQTVSMLKMAKVGIHEITVNEDQALGMTAMRFDINSKDFMMPVDSMIVHLPQKLLQHEMFAKPIDDLIKVFDESVQFKYASQDAIDSWNRYRKQFRTHGDSIAVVVQKYDGPKQNVVARFQLNNTIEFKVFASNDRVFEEDLQAKDLPEFTRLVFRAALSAVMIATMKPEVLQDRQIDKSVEKSRRFFIEKLEKLTRQKILQPTYRIFQPSMKTYMDRTGAGIGKSSAGSKSESPIIIKPVFVWGHWRNQPHGPKRSMRRLQWIKAYIRNKDLLIGENPEIITSSKFTQPDSIVLNEVECSRSV